VLRLIVVLTAAIALAEHFLPWSIAAGVLYTLPCLLSFWIASRRTTLVVAVVCTALTLGGLAFGGENDLWIDGLVNRAFVVFCIWGTANLGILRSRVEQQLAESRETVATTLASIADGVITTGADGNVTLVNERATELLGWKADEAVGYPLANIFRVLRGEGEEAHFEGVSGEAKSDSLPLTKEAVLMRRDGQPLQVEASTAPVCTGAADPSDGTCGRVFVFRDIGERKQREETVTRLAFRDSLTGLPNRTAFLDRLEVELAHARRRNGMTAVLFLDLDDFKAVNDTYGHHAGDVLLKSVAQRLSDALREDDTVARLGGDEFVVILPEVPRVTAARTVAKKLLGALADPIEIPGGQVRTAPSVGVAMYHGESPDVATPPRDADGVQLEEDDLAAMTEAQVLLKRADEAMYLAKQAGGGRVCIWQPQATARPR
jgi:diguanylate cyclase (GGDEF)-like protein/PAS domain S-box-containing protein